MAARGKRRKNRRKPAPKAGPERSGYLRAGLAILLLFAMVGGAAYLLHRFLPATPRPEAPPKKAAVPAVPVKTGETKKPSVYALAPRPGPAPPVPETPGKPRVAIIIDDLGYDLGMARAFLSLEAPLTFSILPGGVRRGEIARLAQEKGREVLLHLPMEPLDKEEAKLEPGTLMAGMGPDAIRAALEKDLDAVPFAVGVNNHMGSRMTSEAEALYPIFTLLKKRGLFFVDSLTTSRSVCRPSARLLQLPFAQRDVFLDHREDAESIRGQLRELLSIAARQGLAVGIAHPHPLTLSVLREALPGILEKAEIVPVSRIVSVPE